MKLNNSSIRVLSLLFVEISVVVLFSGILS